MNRQRGIFTLGIVGSVIAYLVMAGVFVSVLAGINAGLKSHYVAPEKAKWDREKGVLVADKNTCVAANVSLDEQFTTFRNIHNAQIEAARVASEQQKANRAASEKANAPKLADIAMEKFNLIAALGKPGGGLSCDQLDALLLETAKRRTKFYGSGDAPPAPAGTELRLSQPPAPERPKAVNPLVRPK